MTAETLIKGRTGGFAAYPPLYTEESVSFRAKREISIVIDVLFLNHLILSSILSTQKTNFPESAFSGTFPYICTQVMGM
jgi:hypothetical protein